MNNNNNDDDNNNNAGPKKSAFTTFLVRHPFVVMACCLVFVGITTFLWTSVVNKGETNAASPGQTFAIDELEVRRFLAYLETSKNRDRTPVAERSLSEGSYEFLVFYQDTEGAVGSRNLLTPENLRKLFETEEQFRGVTNAEFKYPRGNVVIKGYEQWCQLRYNYSVSPPQSLGCRRPFSLLNDVIFHDEVIDQDRDVTLDMVKALNQSFINDRVAKYTTSEWLSKGHGFFFAKEFKGAPNSNNLTPITRSVFYFGVPIAPDKYYAENNDDAQDERHTSWVSQYTDFFLAPDPPGMQINYIQELLSNQEIGALVQGDFLLAGIAGLTVFALIIVQTQSWFLGCMGFLNIIMSYPITMAAYHGVLQIEIDTQLNLLAIFVILGIGADDIFVFVDAYKQSQHEGDKLFNDVEARMYWVWRRAAEAMLVTSATTFVAFVMTSLSPIPAVATFGIVAGLMVLFNYLAVITWFPACVAVWDYYGLDRRGMCWTSRCVPMPHLVKSSSSSGTGDLENGDNSNNNQEMTTLSRQKSQSSRMNTDVDVSNFRRVERFFYETLSPMLFSAKRYLLTAFVVLFCVMLAFAVQLKPPEEEEFGLPDDSEVVISITLSDKRFPPSKEISKRTNLIWGINPNDPLDNSGIDRNDEKDFGTFILSPPSEFELNNVTMAHINRTCHELKTARNADNRLFVAEQGAQCWVDDFTTWNTAHEKKVGVSPLNWASQPDVAARFKLFVSDEEFGVKWKKNFGGLLDRDNPQRILWTRVSFDNVLLLQTTRSEALYWRAEWEKKMQEINAKAPKQIAHGFQTCDEWAVQVTFNVMVASTFFSIGVSYLVAVVVLTLASRNVTIAAFASLNILGVVVSIIGFIVMAGYTLGPVESIVLVLIVGLSVDFVVHLAVSYSATQTTGRFYRARSALLEMGVSVTSGAVTTLSSSFFLFFTILTFFQVFGTFIFVTIAFSYLWAVFFFMPSMMQLGPRRHPFGDLSYLWNKYVRGVDSESKAEAVEMRNGRPEEQD